MRRQWRYVSRRSVLWRCRSRQAPLGTSTFAGQPAVDIFLNASMILVSMGPIGDLPDTGAKMLRVDVNYYCGIGLLTTVAMVLAPALHRLLHALHLEEGSKMRGSD